MGNYKTTLKFIFIVTFSFGCSQTSQRKENPAVFVENTQSGQHLKRNGAPFFIKGASGSGHFDELKKNGANTVRLYDTINLAAKLDKLDSLGLAAVVDIYLPRYNGVDETFYGNAIKTEKFKQDIRKLVNRYKNHSALLFWMLGNEVYYPTYLENPFIKLFNELIEVIHIEDPDHPVSTTVSSSGLRKLPFIWWQSGDLDFISINNFGSLHEFEERKKLLFFWSKPYLISEWGIHGPWEANRTLWDAPIEISSTQKASIYRENYQNYLLDVDDSRYLGNLVFYWGQKQERTHTWFSLFNREGKRTEVVHELGQLWKGEKSVFDGVQIKSFEIDGKTAMESVMLLSGNSYIVKMAINKPLGQCSVKWELKRENWNIRPHDMEEEPASLLGPIVNQNDVLTIVAPKEFGPYRIYVEIEDDNENIATANIPFYVL